VIDVVCDVAGLVIEDVVHALCSWVKACGLALTLCVFSVLWQFAVLVLTIPTTSYDRDYSSSALLFQSIVDDIYLFRVMPKAVGWLTTSIVSCHKAHCSIALADIVQDVITATYF
jgi:hypothetical protein